MARAELVERRGREAKATGAAARVRARIAGDSDEKEEDEGLQVHFDASTRTAEVGSGGGRAPHLNRPRNTHIDTQEIDEEKHERAGPDASLDEVMHINDDDGLRAPRGLDEDFRTGAPAETRCATSLGSSPHARGGLVSARGFAEEREEGRRAPEVVGHPGGPHMSSRAQEKHKGTSEDREAVISSARRITADMRGNARSSQWAGLGGQVAAPRKKDGRALLRRSEPTGVGMHAIGEREDRQEDTLPVADVRLGKDRPARGTLRKGVVGAGRTSATASSRKGVVGAGRANATASSRKGVVDAGRTNARPSSGKGTIDAGRTIKARRAKASRKCHRMETIQEAPEEEATPMATVLEALFITKFGQDYYPLLEHIQATKNNPNGRVGGNKQTIMGHFRRMVEPITVDKDAMDENPWYDWEQCSRLSLLTLLLQSEKVPGLHKLHLAAARLITPLSDEPTYRDKAIVAIMDAIFSGRLADTTARKYMHQLSLTASEGGTAVAASIAEAASFHAKQNPDGHPHLKALINEHIVRGVTALRRIGIPQDTWRRVLDRITHEDRNASYTSEQGTLNWSDYDEYGSIGNATIVTWNANGLRKAVRTGAFARFLDANTDADIIHINEAKCSPTSLPKVWEFRAAMKARGYKHVYWNWCSIEGRHGDWGCMVLSKLKPLQARFGMGEDQGDPEGRVITLRFKDATLVNTYVPCTSLKGDITDRRVKFEEEMLAHVLDEQSKCKARSLNPLSVYMQGDYNVAAKLIDSNLTPEQQKTQASATNKERELHFRGSTWETSSCVIP